MCLAVKIFKDDSRLQFYQNHTVPQYLQKLWILFSSPTQETTFSNELLDTELYGCFSVGSIFRKQNWYCNEQCLDLICLNTSFASSIQNYIRPCYSIDLANDRICKIFSRISLDTVLHIHISIRGTPKFPKSLFTLKLSEIWCEK